MKKIIATVLAMVMALALCTVAFAGTVNYTEYDKNGNETKDVKFNIEFVSGKYKIDSTSNTVDHYKVTKTSGDTAWTGYYVAADKSDYTSKFTADGKADLYLTYVGKAESAVTYSAKAVEFTNIGDKCGQLDGNSKDTYYKATSEVNDETVIKYYVAKDGAETKLLVDGELVEVTLAGKKSDGELNAHVWKAATYDAKDNVTSYKCKDCGTVATVYKTKDAAKASGAAVYTQYGTAWIAYTDGVTDNTKPANSTTSPKTFDAGIAMYVGMALTSVAGSAVVIGKKKEF